MANQSGPIEIINPGNGLPNIPSISPNSLPCQTHHDPGGGVGGGCDVVLTIPEPCKIDIVCVTNG